MRAVIDFEKCKYSTYRIRFDQSVPLLPCLPEHPLSWRRFQGIDRYVDIGLAAEWMLVLNPDRWTGEATDPASNHRRLLTDLVFHVPGLVEIGSIDDETWFFRPALLFELDIVAHRVIRHVRQHCFPDQRLDVFVMNAPEVEGEEYGD